ncbi:MAG: cell division protein, partial [Gammaproteobacteria bacterium]|nr:cell division protein [Gammaproteobacteria bacterium]
MNTRRAQPTARSRSHTFKHRLVMWALHHVQAFIFSLGQFCRNPLASFLTAAVIGISLALPAGFYVILENARHITSGWEGTVQITAFLKLDIDDDSAKKLIEQLSQRNDIADVRFISSAEALEEYRRLSGFAQAIDAVQENPLPSLLLIHPQLAGLAGQSADGLLKAVQGLPE